LPRTANYRIFTPAAAAWGEVGGQEKQEDEEGQEMKDKSGMKKKLSATANEIRRLGGETGVHC
jgi:hypothetical protein